MGLIELLGISLGLAMDAFAVSVTNGIVNKQKRYRCAVMCAVIFGIFQALMPTIGYLFGNLFSEYIERYAGIIALLLLGFIGGKMIYEATRSNSGETSETKKIGLSMLLIQGIVTSIDALAVGISFSTFQVNIFVSVIIIGIITAIISFIGVIIGSRFGSVLNKRAEIVGGLILVIIGLKIFIENTFFT